MSIGNSDTSQLPESTLYTVVEEGAVAEHGRAVSHDDTEVEESVLNKNVTELVSNSDGRINCTFDEPEGEETVTTIVLDRNEYLNGNWCQLSAFQDNRDLRGTADGPACETSQLCGAELLSSSPGNMNSLDEINILSSESECSEIETVEIIPLSEFLACSDINDSEGTVTAPLGRQIQEDENAGLCQGANPHISEDEPATGASGIQTITRKDSETDNVVVIIRPRSDSSLDLKSNNRVRPRVSSYQNVSGSSSNSMYSCNEKPSNHLNQNISLNTDIKDHGNETDILREHTAPAAKSLQWKDTSSEETYNDCSNMEDATPKEKKGSETGTRPKRWIRTSTNNCYTDPDMLHEVPENMLTTGRDVKMESSHKESTMEESGCDWDEEDKLIWELLKSMKSVTKPSTSGSDSAGKDFDLCSKDNSVDNGNDDNGSEASGDHHVTPSSEQNDSLDSVGDKERDKFISEKLQKRYAGDVTCITFVSPSYDTSHVKFTPIERKDPLTLDAKGFFQKGFNASRSDLPTSSREYSPSNQKTLISSKLPSPQLFTHVTTQSPFAMSSTQLILPKLSLISKSASFSASSNKHEQRNSSSDDTLESDDDLNFEEKMDSGSSTSLSDSLNNALEMLNSSRLEDAEKHLLKLYQQMQEKPEDNTKILVQVLTGLADVCIRRSRMCRSNPMEWQWLCMHAISLLQYTSDVCDSELEEDLDNIDTEWYTEHKQAADVKCRPLEDSFNRALYNCLKHEGRKFMDPFRSFSFPNTPSTPSLGLFPLSSGNSFSLYPSMHDRLTGKTENQTSMDDSNVGLDWLSKFLQYCHDRIQSKNLGDIFNRLFKRKVSSLKENNDDTASVMSESSCSSLDWDHGDLQGIDEIDLNAKDTPVPVDAAFGFELPSSDVDEDGWDFFLNDRKNCKFQRSGRERKESMANQNLLDVRARDDRYIDKEIISPLHEHNIKLTLAKSYTRLADKLVTEEEYRKAEVLYEQVMGILDEVQDGTAGMLRFSAKVMKNLGTVKSKQGKSSAGLALLNQALETYRDLQDEESNFEIAIALLELGNGYVVGKNNEDGVYDDAISAIREFFEKDFSDGESSNSSPNKSEPSSPQKTAEEEKNIEEAAHCYKEALSLLHGRDSEEQGSIVIAKATMRLGDCYFMQKDYDRALECFEKAHSLFRSTSTQGRELVLENAHVMCMLGVSSFMLHIYPRAATVFELALHLVKYAFGLNSTYLHGLIISFMGITFYKMKNYHRCVSMCYQAFELFCNMHGSKLPDLPRSKFWIVCQVLYVMGNSYNIISLHQKAIKYLTVARTLMMASKMRDRRQFMRVLQILGDCHFAQYDYKIALGFYNEALEYGECESQISFDEVFDPNSMSDDMTMHNQLVSKSAEAHISMQQYQNAVHYLEQAHDIQEVLGEDIKGDLISTLYQLGHIHSMAGDVDKAIESFEESLEVYKEIHKGELGPDMCATLGNLASMCYVKACVCEDNEGELEMIIAAEQHFQDALKLDQNPSVCVKYGNFLYSQGNYDDAIMYLEDALKIEDIDVASDLVYGGLDKVTLPDCLQDEVDTQEEVVLPPTSLARYLLILSHKMLNQMDLAEKHLFHLLYEALETDIPILYSVLGYSMMEMGLFEEAIWSFGSAISLENEYSLAIDNYCTCLLICTMRTLQRAIENICLYYGLTCYVNLYW